MPSDDQIVKCAQGRLVIPEIAIRNFAMQNVERSSKVIILVSPQEMAVRKAQTGEKDNQENR
jgi:hypothetical protein